MKGLSSGPGTFANSSRMQSLAAEWISIVCKALQSPAPAEWRDLGHVEAMRRLFLLCLAAGLVSGARAELNWRPLGEPGSGGWLVSLRANPKDPNHLLLGGDMLGVGMSRDGGKSWGGGFGLPSWEIADFTFDPTNPEVVWAGTMSGPVVSRDGGMTWESKRKGFPPVEGGFYSAPIQRVMIDPANPQRLLAFAGSYRGWDSPGSPKHGYIWESLDGGENWTEFSSIRPFRNITWVDADSKWGRMYATVVGRGVHVSEDRGKTWKPANEGLPKNGDVRMVAAHPNDPNIAWVGVGNYRDPSNNSRLLAGGIFRTEDGGQTWQPSSEGLAQAPGKEGAHTSRYQAVAVSPVNPDHLITSDLSWTHNSVYASTDGGRTWQLIMDREKQRSIPLAYPAGMGATVTTFCPVNPSTIYVANSESVAKSTNLGETWTDITASPVKAPQAAESGAAETPSAASEPQLTFRGHGYSGLCSTSVVFNPFRAGAVVLTAMDAAKHVRSNDDMASWFFEGKGFSQAWGGSNDVAFAKPDGAITYLAVGQHGGQGAICRTNDGGLTWQEFRGASYGLPDGAEAVAVHCDPEQPDRAWAVMGRKFFATENGGKSWKENTDLPQPVSIGKPSGAAFPFYVGTSAGIYRTDDGRTFQLLPNSPASPVRIHVPAGDPNSPLAVRHRVEGGGVFRKSGDTWDRIFKDSHAFEVAVHPQNPKRLAVVTQDDPYHDVSRATGVWISEDGGSEWRQANNGLSCLRGKAIAFNPHRPETLVVGTFGRGFFVAEWPEGSN